LAPFGFTLCGLISSQHLVIKWHKIIGENTFADANLDHILHKEDRIELSEESIRKRNINTISSLGEVDKKIAF